MRHDDLLEHVPDIRVADLPNIVRLFEGKDGDKLIPLLEAEKLFAWARPMGKGEPAQSAFPAKFGDPMK